MPNRRTVPYWSLLKAKIGQDLDSGQDAPPRRVLCPACAVVSEWPEPGTASTVPYALRLFVRFNFVCKYLTVGTAPADRQLDACSCCGICCFESGSINRQAVRRGEKLIRSSFPPQIQEDSETYEMNILAKVVAVGLVATLCCANHNTAIKVRHAAPRRACLLAQILQASPRPGVEERSMRARFPLIAQYCSSCMHRRK